MTFSAQFVDYYPDYFYLTYHANADEGMQSWIKTFQDAIGKRETQRCRELLQMVKRLTIAPEFEQVVYHAEGMLAEQRSEYSAAISLFQRALEMKIPNEPADSHIILLADLARVYQTVGEYEQAESIIQQALQLMPNGRLHATSITPIIQLIKIQFDRGNWEAAGDLLEKAADMAISPEEKAILAANRGIWHSLRGEWTPSIEQFGQAISQFKQLNLLNSLARTHNQVGVVALEQRDFLLGRHHLTKGLEIAQKLDDWQTINHLLGNFALLLAEEGEVEQAIDVCTQAILSLDALGDRFALATFYRLRGTFYHDITSYELALADHQQCLQLVQSMEVRPNIAATYINLGNVYRRLEQFPTALIQYEYALTIAAEIGDHKSLATAWNGIGTLHDLEKQYDLAEKAYQNAFEQAYLANAGDLAASAALGLSLNAFETLSFDVLHARLDQAEELATIANRYDFLMQIYLIWSDLAFLSENVEDGIQAIISACRYATRDGPVSVKMVQEHFEFYEGLLSKRAYQAMRLALQPAIQHEAFFQSEASWRHWLASLN